MMNSSAELATEEFCLRFPRVNLSDSNRRIEARGAQVVEECPDTEATPNSYIGASAACETNSTKILSRIGIWSVVGKLDDGLLFSSTGVPKGKTVYE
jgi:hypothetical protein